MWNRHYTDDAAHRREQQKRGPEGQYSSAEYYRRNHDMGNTGAPSRYNFRPDEGPGYNDLNTQDYDSFNSGKYENFEGGGYYGSNYGSINHSNGGRDYEQNSGYRNNYNQLPVGEERDERSPQGREGRHRGKGPKTYERSDDRIREDIHDLLADDPYIDATEIEVSVEKGEVTLNGFVHDKNAKRRVEDLIDSVKGVKNLENRLRGGQANRSVNIRNSE
jgi:hypothetical protein